VKTRILIAEDEAIVASHIRRLLEGMGHEVMATVATGEDAVTRALALFPDLILMDIVLGGAMDGIRAAENIRKEKDIPIVFLTAYVDDATLSRAKVTGPSGYVVKPFEEKDLRAAVEIGLYKHRIECELRGREEQLVRLAKLEGIVADIASELIGVTPSGVPARCRRMLATIGQFVGADTAFVHLFENGSEVIREVFEWHREQGKPLRNEFQGSDASRFRWMMNRFRENEPICILRTSDIPVEANLEREFWLALGVRSLLLVPLNFRGAPLGYIGIATEGAERFWTGENIRLLRIIAQNVMSLLVRQRAEDAWLASEEKFRLLVENLKEVVFALDDNGYFTYISQGVEDLSGYTPDELIGEHLTRFVHPHDRASFEDKWEFVRSGRMGSFELRLLTREGNIRDVRLSSRNVYLGEEATGIAGIIVDVSQQKLAENALRESEERYRRLWEDSTDGLVLIDAESGIILDCNEEFSLLIGRPKEQLTAMRIWEIRPSHIQDLARQKFLEIRERGTGGSSELNFEKPDGTEARFEFKSRVLTLQGRMVIQSRCRKLP
jgi:PAS domain S-box-containing protein